MPLSTTARALDLMAKTPFSVSTTFEAFAARSGDPDQADAFPVPAVISAPLSFEEGMRLYREAARLRAETGLSPLVIAEEALSNMELSDGSPGQGPWAGALEQRRRFEAKERVLALLLAALDNIAAESGAAIAIKTDRTVAVMVTRGESLLSLTHVLVLDGSRRGGLVV